MAITQALIAQYSETFQAVRSALEDYDIPEGRRGIACARGTLLSRQNSLSLMADALKTREVTTADTNDLAFTVRTLTWLRTDDYVTKDFAGVELTVAPTQLVADYPAIGMAGPTDFETAMTLLIRGLTDVLQAKT